MYTSGVKNNNLKNNNKKKGSPPNGTCISHSVLGQTHTYTHTHTHTHSGGYPPGGLTGIETQLESPQWIIPYLSIFVIILVLLFYYYFQCTIDLQSLANSRGETKRVAGLG